MASLVYERENCDNIEKKVDIFPVLNGILAKTRNLIFKKIKVFLVILWILGRWSIEWSITITQPAQKRWQT